MSNRLRNGSGKPKPGKLTRKKKAVDSGERAGAAQVSILDRLLVLWKEEKNVLRQLSGKGAGPRTLHTVRRSLRISIRIGRLMKIAGLSDPVFTKRMRVLKRVYSRLGAFREQDVLEDGWNRFFREYPVWGERERIPGAENKKGYRRKRNRALSKALEKAETWARPVIERFPEEDVNVGSRIFFQRVQRVLANRDRTLLRLAGRWEKLGPSGRHRLRKIAREIRETCELVHKADPSFDGQGEMEGLLGRIVRVLGRIHDQDRIVERFSRIKRFSARDRLRAAAFWGWQSGRTRCDRRRIVRLMKRYRKACRLRSEDENGLVTPSVGVFQKG
ncbi:MAG: hypothetical protein ACYCRD_01815 [Leptospirillum sp.]